jgi:hypothetical protein
MSQQSKWTAPHDDEAADGLCIKCGMKGDHVSARDCINALRDRLAHLELRVTSEREIAAGRRDALTIPKRQGVSQPSA